MFWASGLCLLYQRICYIKLSYIEVLFHTFYCNFGWGIEYCLFFKDFVTQRFDRSKFHCTPNSNNPYIKHEIHIPQLTPLFHEKLPQMQLLPKCFWKTTSNQTRNKRLDQCSLTQPQVRRINDRCVFISHNCLVYNS